MEKKHLKCPYDSTEWDDEYALSEHLAAAHYSARGNLKVHYICACGKSLVYAREDPKVLVHLLGHLRQTADPDLREKVLSEIDRLTRR